MLEPYTLTQDQRQAIVDMVAKLDDKSLCDIAYGYRKRENDPTTPRPVLEAALLKCRRAADMYRSRGNGEPEEKYRETCLAYEAEAKELSALTTATFITTMVVQAPGKGA